MVSGGPKLVVGPCAKCSHGSHLCGLQMSDLDRQLWRGSSKRLGGARTLRPEFKPFGPKWGRVLQTYMRRVPPEAQSVIAAELVPLKECCEACWLDRLSLVSQAATRRSIDQGFGWFSYLCDLKVLGGYDTALNRVDIMDDFVKAATRAPLGNDTPKMREYIQEAVDKLGTRHVSQQVTFEQFVEFRDEYALAGASTHGAGLVLEIRKGKTVKRKTVKGKFSSLVGLKDEDIVELALQDEAARVFPFRKIDEPAKTRVVQSYDTRSFIRCSWLSYLLSSYNTHGTWTTLGMSRKERAVARAEIMAWSSLEGISLISLDQSEFDQRQDKSAVRFAMERICDKIERTVRPELRSQVRLVTQRELSSFDRAAIWERTPEGPRRVADWLAGVPSGHKWTALIDTILNYAATRVAMDACELKIAGGLWHGDDGLVAVFGGLPDAAKIAGAYAQLGLKVNSAKTWVSSRRCEYLHEVHGPEGAWGFPARAFKSILWRKPFMGEAGFTPPHVETQQYLDTLMKCSRRRLVNIFDLAVATVKAELEASGERDAARRAVEACITPCALGGLGWGRTGRRSLEWTPPVLKYKHVSITSPVAIRGPASVVASAVLRRVGAVTPLPASAARLHSAKVSKTSLPPLHAWASESRAHRVRDQWVLADANRIRRPWLAKITLEHALATGRPISKGMVPDSRVADSPLGCDVAARLVHRFGSFACSLESSFSSGEPFAAYEEWAARIWSGIVNGMVAFRALPSFVASLSEAGTALASVVFACACAGASGCRVGV